MPKRLPSPKVIGIVGSRRRDSDEDFRLCLAAFKKVYKKGDRIVSGGCKDGADRFAEIIALEFGYSITIHYPRKEDLDQAFGSKEVYTANGMTLRDWFAGLIIQGMVSHPSDTINPKRAYELADEMIQSREK